MKTISELVWMAGLLSVFSINAAVAAPKEQNISAHEEQTSQAVGKCIPTTCKKAKANCGDLSDGCGKVLHCGIAEKAVVSVTPPHYSGTCPTTFTFTASVSTSKTGTIPYTFSNHYISNGISMDFVKKGELVFTTPGTQQASADWTVPANLLQKNQYIQFNACGIETLHVPFEMKCLAKNIPQPADDK